MKFNIGIIDDDTIANVELASIFSELGYTNIHWFLNPEHCYEMFESGLQLDLLLINWKFEEQNIDFGLASKLRCKGINCPIIFIIKNYQKSGSDLELEILKTNIYKYGAINVLTKPYDSSSVYYKIESAKKIARNRLRAIREKQKPNLQIFEVPKPHAT